MADLLYCGNLDMFDGVMLSLMSAAVKTQSPITAYIMTMDLRELNESYVPFEDFHIKILNTALKRFNPGNSVILLDATSIFYTRLGDSANIENAYTPYALLRLFALEFDLPERLLYVDTDIMFHGDVSQIESYDIENYELGGVTDHLGKRFIGKGYINTGVLYLNIKKIRETKLFERALELCLTKKMVFPDQDAINELIEYKLILPEKFNEQHKLKKDTVIQHFCKSIRFFPIFKVINIKQWQINSVHKILKIRAYDAVFAKFLEYRYELGKDLLKPFKQDKPPNFFKQLKFSFKELKSYIKQNGGIFRRKTKD